MDIDAWGTKATSIFLDDGFALRTDLECLDLQMGELQASLNADATSTETDIPEDTALGEFEGLKCQQTDRHLGDHLLATIEQGEV